MKKVILMPKRQANIYIQQTILNCGSLAGPMNGWCQMVHQETDDLQKITTTSTTSLYIKYFCCLISWCWIYNYCTHIFDSVYPYMVPNSNENILFSGVLPTTPNFSFNIYFEKENICWKDKAHTTKINNLYESYSLIKK
jgi:hypothetical protein